MAISTARRCVAATTTKAPIFRISLTGDYAIVHHFNGSEGENPEGTLIVGSDGGLYGTTLQGGSDNRGTIYRFTTGGVLTSLYSFPSLSAFSHGVAINATGANPRAGLRLAADGNYYGTAYQGGPTGYGTVFRMTPAGAVSVLHGFGGPATEGAFPLAGVVQDTAGNFYGTTNGNTQLGGIDQGSAWRISSSGQFSLLHGFVDLGPDGSNPYAGLLLANGTIYGASYVDSSLGSGGIFKLDLGSNGCAANRALGVAGRNHREFYRRRHGDDHLVFAWCSDLHCTRGLDRRRHYHVGYGDGDTEHTRNLYLRAQLHRRCGGGAQRVHIPQCQGATSRAGRRRRGAGALSVPLLLLLAVLLSRRNSREIFTA